MHFQTESLIYPVRQTAMLRILPVFPVTVRQDARYEAILRPFTGLRQYKRAEAFSKATIDFFRKRHMLSIVGDHLELTIDLPQEDSYIIELYIDGIEAEKLEIYALEPDLFSLNAYRGDNHMHTWMSDGKDSPMYMAAMSCRRGCDYCLITDHHKYEPSLIAKRFYEGTGVDFLVIPGEEIHSPDNPVHIISIGGRESVNAWWREDDREYRAAVREAIAEVDDTLLPEDRYTAAACQTVFDRIRAVGGVSVLCHPHWVLSQTHALNEHEDVTDYLMDHRRFDVLELIAGGAFEVGTQMQISYYHDRPTMPIVGSSDAHGCFLDQLEPHNYTICFAESLTVEGIQKAIRSGLTVGGNENKLYGEYRLVKYAYFLKRCFFPRHEALRDRVGVWMLRYASARDEADAAIYNGLKCESPSKLFESLRYQG
ncbi:MAG: hypothetical protein IJ234_09725 [Clostridia bacterium]|nr:hypothetical protein [Clostridia bacterium]